MTPPSADRSVRVAVLGAASPAGVRLRDALAARGLPASNVDLYASRPGEALLGEYDGEARLLQDPIPEDVLSADLVFVCEASAVAEGIVSRRAADTRLIDLVGVVRDAPLAHVPLRPPSRDRPVVRVPHPLAIVLAELVHPVTTVARFDLATAFVLRPAADFGEAGLEELREQTLKLLRFETPPTEVFGRQLAFNLVPQSLVPGEGRDLEARVADEAAVLLGGAVRLELALVVVPVFHGHALCVRLEGQNGDPAAVAAAIASAPGLEAPTEGAAATPIEGPEERRTIVSGIRGDRSTGLWLWATAAEAPSSAAVQAVRIAEEFGRWTT